MAGEQGFQHVDCGPSHAFHREIKIITVVILVADGCFAGDQKDVVSAFIDKFLKNFSVLFEMNDDVGRILLHLFPDVFQSQIPEFKIRIVLGETLHNLNSEGVLADGRLLLVDAGGGLVTLIAHVQFLVWRRRERWRIA